LFWTSDKSAIQNEPYDINPLTQRGKYLFDQKGQVLGVLLTGKFNSYWKEDKPPVTEEGEPVTEEEILRESPETRMVVISDANFLQDQYIVPGLDNLIMTLNLIDWLSQDEALISIRSKDVGSRPIKADIADSVRRTVKYANMIIPPILVIGFGLVRWRTRKAARRMALRDLNVDRTGGKN
jgi:hypothetical protein